MSVHLYVSDMLKDLEQQLEDIRKVEEQRSSLFEDVVNKVKQLYIERDKLQSKLEQAEDSRDKYFNEHKESRNQMEEMRLKMDANPFCLVLIDADNTLFCDGYVKRGSDGGRDAAVHLNGNLTKLLRAKANLQPHWKVIIRLYANISQLGKVYVSSGIIHNHLVWQNFVQAFNKETSLSEFVDAGGDKESADTRIKAQENFSLFSTNVHCKHIVLAASGDNGYTIFLRQFAPLQGASDFVTLIEARTFPTQLRQIAASFQIEKLPSMFRNSDLGSIKSPSAMPNHQTFGGSVAKVPLVSWNPSIEPAVYPTGYTSTQPQALLASPSTSSSKSLSHIRSIGIRYNRNGHRLDPNMRYEKRLYASLKERKLCNAFFLSKCQDANCRYDHSGALSREELNTLSYIARLKPCQSIYCENVCCVSGHVCPYDGKCYYSKTCKFPSEMHNVDKNIDNARTRWIVI